MQKHRERYYRLLALRGDAQLTASPGEAKRDYENVLAGRELYEPSPESLPLFLGKGRAHLLLPSPEPLKAFGIAEACLPLVVEAPDPLQDEVWDLALDALQLIVEGADSAGAQDLLKRLAKSIQLAPAEVRQRYKALQQSGGVR
jgi:hypothetical protein